MRENTIAGHAGTHELTAQISAEIMQALNELKKHGYAVQFEEIPDQRDELAMTFQFGESRQTIRIARKDWKDSGTVYGAIVDHLDI